MRLALFCRAAAGVLLMTLAHAPNGAQSEASGAPALECGYSPAGGEQRGVNHVVERGQTLWRIARAYGIGLDELARANDIADPTKIETGQVLFIPDAPVPLEVPAHPAPEREATPSLAALLRDRDSAKWQWPVADPQVLSPFGARRRSGDHRGIDVRGASGSPVVASRAGRVVYSGSGMRGYGRTIVVDHGDGTSSLYAHNSRLLVRKGQHVERGQAIAHVGRSGNATTDHCHFEIRHRGRAVDPLPHLDPIYEARR